MNKEWFAAIDVNDIVKLALSAGEAAMEIYSRDFEIEYKEDHSPLTEADKTVHKIIYEGLKNFGQFPLLSEEGKDISWEERKDWEKYWCIDPIDGTKEFIKKNGEFTINIALIYRGEPVLGVVLAPALNEIYWAKKGSGAYKGYVTDAPGSQKTIERISKLPLPALAHEEGIHRLRIVASRSHLNAETESFIEHLKNIFFENKKSGEGSLEKISRGSSLKLLMVAEGSADFYPRLAPTMEWDTAAADAILRESGKKTYVLEEKTLEDFLDLPTLRYNKVNLRNPSFLCG